MTSLPLDAPEAILNQHINELYKPIEVDNKITVATRKLSSTDNRFTAGLLLLVSFGEHSKMSCINSIGLLSIVKSPTGGKYIHYCRL